MEDGKEPIEPRMERRRDSSESAFGQDELRNLGRRPVEKRGSIGPDEDDEHDYDGKVAEQRQEMVLRHLEKKPYRGGHSQNRRRCSLLSPEQDVSHSSAA